MALVVVEMIVIDRTTPEQVADTLARRHNLSVEAYTAIVDVIYAERERCVRVVNECGTGWQPVTPDGWRAKIVEAIRGEGEAKT